MENVFFYAKPSATNVTPYIIPLLSPSLSSNQVKSIIITGKSFLNLRNVYLSASNTTIFTNSNYQYFDPFSSVSKLSLTNKGFSGIVIENFTVISEKYVIFDLPDEIFYSIGYKKPFNCKLDVIIENEAGYGLLTRDSIKYNFITQNPAISGIYMSTY
jgi:hypothetical protein